MSKQALESDLTFDSSARHFLILDATKTFRSLPEKYWGLIPHPKYKQWRFKCPPYDDT